MLTTCPHCLHTIKNEYPAFGGEYQVVHHTQLISDLISNGQIKFKDGRGPVSLGADIHPSSPPQSLITFHDPCYLGRQNDILTEPRLSIQQAGAKLIEMPRSRAKSFCCGAGGAQMWKDEEHGHQAVNANRFQEAVETKADILAVGCPFCMLMMNDAAKDANAMPEAALRAGGPRSARPGRASEMQVLDVAEIVAANLLE